MAFDFFTSLDKGCAKLGVDLDGDARDNLYTYFVELKKWSKKVNLIAKGTGDEEIVENHFVDSLALLRLLPRDGGLVDIGTGAGLPGLVCKAACPEMKVFLVEPRAKRVSFLQHIVRSLDLKNVHIHCNRIEEVPELATDRAITHITSRAVSDIKGFVEMTEAFCDHPALRLCLKGPKWQEELVDAQHVLTEHGLEVMDTDEYVLPVSKATRALVVLKK